MEHKAIDALALCFFNCQLHCFIASLSLLHCFIASLLPCFALICFNKCFFNCQLHCFINALSLLHCFIASLLHCLAFLFLLVIVVVVAKRSMEHKAIDAIASLLHRFDVIVSICFIASLSLLLCFIASVVINPKHRRQALLHTSICVIASRSRSRSSLLQFLHCFIASLLQFASMFRWFAFACLMLHCFIASLICFIASRSRSCSSKMLRCLISSLSSLH